MKNNKYELVLPYIINNIFIAILFSNSLKAIIIFSFIHYFIFKILHAKIKNTKWIISMQLLLLFLLLFMLVVSNSYMMKYGDYYFEGGSDDFAFEMTAFKISNSNSSYLGIAEDIFVSNRNIHPDHNSKLYIFILSICAKFFGEGYSLYIPRIINIYLLLINLVIIYLILNGIFKINKNNAFKKAFIISLLPINIVLSVNTFRDTLVLTIILLFYYVVNNPNEKKIFKYFTLIILVIMTYWIRKPFLVLLLIILVIQNKKKVFKNPIFILILGICFFYLYNSFNYLIIRYIGNYSNRLRFSANDGLSNLIFNRDLLPLGLPLRFLYGIISPLPSFGNIVESAIGVNTFIITGVYISIILSYKKLKYQFKLFLICIAQYFIIILTTFSFRHFLFNSIMIVLLASTLEISKRTKYMSLIINLGFWLLLAIMYSIMKI